MEIPRNELPLWMRFLTFELLPDPGGIVGFGVAVGVLASYLLLPSDPGGHLWSEDPCLECLGHVWLLAGPPLSAFLGVRHLLVKGDSILPLVSVPLAFFLTILTGVGVSVALLSA